MRYGAQLIVIFITVAHGFYCKSAGAIPSGFQEEHEKNQIMKFSTYTKLVPSTTVRMKCLEEFILFHEISK
jgi:hypothetical protein